MILNILFNQFLVHAEIQSTIFPEKFNQISILIKNILSYTVFLSLISLAIGLIVSLIPNKRMVYKKRVLKFSTLSLLLIESFFFVLIMTEYLMKMN